jgi:hypothetical protein
VHGNRPVLAALTDTRQYSSFSQQVSNYRQRQLSKLSLRRMCWGAWMSCKEQVNRGGMN